MERPILFSGPMVRAILDGRKTQTRRVVKLSAPAVRIMQFRGRDNELLSEFGVCVEYENVINRHISCPYGVPGDRLWVREAFHCGDGHPLLYRATTNLVTGLSLKWKPSIHMRREYSRINLEIIDVRVEHLQDIKDEDAKAEGAPLGNYGDAYTIPQQLMNVGAFPEQSHVYGFQQVWGVINGHESWTENPWVWVV